MLLLEILSGDNRDTLTDLEERDEEKMLRRAIAMSLQGEEDVPVSIKGELLKQIFKPQRYANLKLQPTNQLSDWWGKSVELLAWLKSDLSEYLKIL